MIITSNCVNLKEVNFAKAQISESAINYLVENLTPNLEKLSLLCQSQITDKHVWALVNRCNKLCTLVLRNTCTTDASVTDIIEKLESTLEELDIHRFCYGYHVKPDKLFGLRKLPKFKVLNYSGASSDEIENKGSGWKVWLPILCVVTIFFLVVIVVSVQNSHPESKKGKYILTIVIL